MATKKSAKKATKTSAKAGQKSLDASIERVRRVVEQRASNGTLGDIDNMTIKELRLQAFQEAERLVTNDQKASIVSVVVYVAVT